MENGNSTPEHGRDLELTPVIDHLTSKFIGAVKNTNSDELEEVLADPCFELPQDALNQALRFACGRNDAESIRVLCEGSGRRAEINSKDEKGRTATYISARLGHAECLRKLLELGAKVNISTAEKKKWSTAVSKHSDAYEELRFQMPLDERGGMSPLHAAARINSPECVKLLLEKGGDVKAVDELKQQAVLFAGAWMENKNEESIRKYEEVLRQLLDKGADASANYVDSSHSIPVNMSVLQTAARLGSETAVRILLEKGADPEWGGDKGCCRTALHEAAKGGHLGVLQLLLQNTVESNNKERWKWVNQKDYAGNTALHLSAICASKDCISCLLEKGGNLGVMNNSGMTVMEAILIHIPDAKDFIRELLDSKVKRISTSAEPKDFKVSLNFKILAPNGRKRRAEVVNSLISARHIDSDALIGIIDHPLVKAYINLEFARFKVILGLLLCIYFLQVIFTLLFLYFSASGDNIPLHSLSIFFSTLVALLVGHRLFLNPRYYIFRSEIWSNGIGAILSITGLVSLWICPIENGVVTNIISLACLLQWIGLMSVCGLLPFIGTRTLIFGDVCKNLFWATVSLVFVIIGYSLFFYLQLRSSHDQFIGLLTSFESTIIMLIQDHQHGDIYAEHRPPGAFLRIMFVFFMFIGPMLVLNILLSLTVSDKELMISRGKIRRLIRMIEYLDYVDKSFISRIRFLTKKEVISSMVIRPYKVQNLGKISRIFASFFPSLFNHLPRKVEAELVSLASRKI